MAVDDALGVAGRAGGVAHRGGRALVNLGPLVVGRAGGQQLLVIEDLGQVLGGGAGLAVHHDDVFDRGDLPGGLFEDGQQVGVHEENPVGGVVDDKRQLVEREAHVERVEDGAHAGSGQI